jgi:hypothetical protein
VGEPGARRLRHLKSDGYPTYHLAHLVDDHLMEISHVLVATSGSRAHRAMCSCTRRSAGQRQRSRTCRRSLARIARS